MADNANVYKQEKMQTRRKLFAEKKSKKINKKSSWEIMLLRWSQFSELSEEYDTPKLSVLIVKRHVNRII